MVNDRPRGILSPADRDYLENPDSRSAPAQHKRREAIVERTHEAIFDLALLGRKLPDELREDIFTREIEGREHVLNETSSALAFIFLGLADLENPHLSELEVIENFVEGAIQSMYSGKGMMIDDVSVEIETDVMGEFPEPDEIAGWTLSEAKEKLASDEISPQVFLKYAIEKYDADEIVQLDLVQFDGLEDHDPDKNA